MKKSFKEEKKKTPQERDILLLKSVYTIIGVIMLLVMQIAPFPTVEQRIRISLIVFVVIFGVGFNATRNLKIIHRKKEENKMNKENKENKQNKE
ncbi:MAG: DUF4018 domain-containing protein [Tissierellia bacterium]|nr:DUF4018 domain-containing protein [Tissierellia bacterium]